MSQIRPPLGGIAAELWDICNENPPRPEWAWIDMNNTNIVTISELGKYNNPKPTASKLSDLLVTCDNPQWVASASSTIYSCNEYGIIFCVRPRLRTLTVYEVDDRGALLKGASAQISLPWKDYKGREKALEDIALLSKGTSVPKSSVSFLDKNPVKSFDEVL